MDPDALLLLRIQVAFTVSIGIMFPTFTVGRAAWLAEEATVAQPELASRLAKT
jgi:cytochrome bd-type quinol oxidase subunit 1